MTAATYQYVDLPDAAVVTTRALLTARENITDTVAARAMMGCELQVWCPGYSDGLPPDF
jgi:hypothetical protein